jgi:sugar-specific transcriptional regulator TrmB
MEIAENSKVARPDVYPTLRRLRELGLVENLIKTPPEYRAVPLKEGLNFRSKNKSVPKSNRNRNLTGNNQDKKIKPNRVSVNPDTKEKLLTE